MKLYHASIMHVKVLPHLISYSDERLHVPGRQLASDTKQQGILPFFIS